MPTIENLRDKSRLMRGVYMQMDTVVADDKTAEFEAIANATIRALDHLNYCERARNRVRVKRGRVEGYTAVSVPAAGTQHQSVLLRLLDDEEAEYARLWDVCLGVLRDAHGPDSLHE